MNAIFLAVLLAFCFSSGNASLDLAEKLMLLNADLDEDISKEPNEVQKDWMVQDSMIVKTFN